MADEDLEILSEEGTPEEESSPEELQEDESDIDEELEQDEELDRIIKSLIKTAEEEDTDLRYNLLRNCKRNDLYFNNIQTIFFDEVAQDYRTIDSVLAELDANASMGNIKVINVYKAYAESIIAALSVQPPNVRFMPDDAENPSDLETAQAYSKIVELVAKHNHAGLMLIKALTILYNSGTIFAHNFYKTDPSYGMARGKARTKRKEKTVVNLRCAACAEPLDGNVPAEDPTITQPAECPACGNNLPPVAIPEIIFEDEVVGYDETPKGRSGFDIFGPTYVKAPLYARNQAGVGYLILRVEEHIARIKSTYDTYDVDCGGGEISLYERWARVPLEYQSSVPKDIATIRYCWFRPWYYKNLTEEDADYLTNKFPNGFMAAIVHETILEKRHASIDDEWTVSFDPKANFVHAEPAGNVAIPVQDAKNDVFNLGLQSIEYGIPETYVHPRTLNLTAYAKNRSAPGMLTQAMPPEQGKSIGDGFYTSKAATLSNEYTNFDAKLDQTGQFVTGAMPAIFGGTTKNGDTTASEYSQSRSTALQRLQLTWEMIQVFWSSLMFKCAKDYASNLREDEKFTKAENGTFVNVWIRKTSLEGKVGHVEPELSGSLPQSWAQKKDLLMKLIEMQSEEIGAILLHPNNSSLVKDIVGLNDMYIPGEFDRNKQYQEFYILSASEPTSEVESSIPIDIDVDDHAVHMQVLKNILVSSKGINLYKTNPMAYQNCILHYRQHQMAIQAKTMAPSGMTGINEPPESSSGTTQG